jgi:hypothetical protein
MREPLNTGAHIMLSIRKASGSPPPPPPPSTWTPASLTTSLWLDAAEASTFTFEDTDLVTQWRDKSGNTRHADQSATASKPIRAASSQFGVTALNANAVVYFDGSNDHLTFASSLLNGSTTFTVVMVMTATGGQDNRGVFGPSGVFGQGIEMIYGSSGTAGIPQIRLSSQSYSAFTDGSNLPLWSNSNTATISVITFATNGMSAWTNGQTPRTSATGTGAGLSTVGTYALGLYYTTAQSIKMGMAEFIIMPTSATTDERQRLEGYLAHKWGLTSVLPNTGDPGGKHPYKDSAPTA